VGDVRSLLFINQLHEKIGQQQKQYISPKRKEDQAYRYDDDVSLSYQ
jgi:xylose isomerase